jgi:hypothetical protein
VIKKAIHAKTWFKNVEEKRPFGRTSIGGKIISKWILRK